jgi:hypothetical protein
VIARSAVTWRYLPGRQLKHALQVAATLTGHRSVALCGIGPAWYVPDTEQWWGTGSQAEYDHVAQARECKRCVSRLAPIAQTVNA